MTTPTPTTRTYTRKSGETVTVTEWTIGAYTLRKTEEPSYTAWSEIDRETMALIGRCALRAAADDDLWKSEEKGEEK